MYNAIAAGTTMIYGAMFYVVDERTAVFTVLADRHQVPVGQSFGTLDAEGCALPADWYLQLAGKATAALAAGFPEDADQSTAPK